MRGFSFNSGEDTRPAPSRSGFPPRNSPIQAQRNESCRGIINARRGTDTEFHLPPSRASKMKDWLPRPFLSLKHYTWLNFPPNSLHYLPPMLAALPPPLPS